MANTKTTGAKTSAAKNTVKTKSEEEIPVKESDTEKKYRDKQTVDMNTIIPVRNGFQGTLIYKSRRTQEVFEWGAFGDEQDMTIQELRDAKNSSKSFFISIHAPREGVRLRPRWARHSCKRISIHAPREGVRHNLVVFTRFR